MDDDRKHEAMGPPAQPTAEYQAALRTREATEAELHRKLAALTERGDDLVRQVNEQVARGKDLERQIDELKKGDADLRVQLRRQQERAEDLTGQIHRLEGELETREAVEAQLRRSLATQTQRYRELATATGAEADLVNSTIGLSKDEERRLFDGHPFSSLAQSYASDERWWPELQKIKAFSMLHYETLYLLQHFARETRGAVLEVGPYIGGSTIALGRGVEAGSGGPLISIEKGGANPAHSLSTSDIVADLRKNVAAFKLSRTANILEGFSTDPHIDARVNELLNGRKIGLLFLDADGNVERDFGLYRDRLANGAIIALDDYLTFGLEPAPEKTNAVRLWAEQALRVGIVEALGLYRWGTWFGRYKGPV